MAEQGRLEVFRWLEELNYNCEHFAEAKYRRAFQAHLAFAGKDTDAREHAIDFLQACIEHADELTTACRKLLTFIEDATNG